MVTRKIKHRATYYYQIIFDLKNVYFQTGVDSSGFIQYLNVNLYEDNGYKINEAIAALGLEVHSNCYDSKRWNFSCFNGITDTAKNSWCRAPCKNFSFSCLILWKPPNSNYYYIIAHY